MRKWTLETALVTVLRGKVGLKRASAIDYLNKHYPNWKKQVK